MLCSLYYELSLAPTLDKAKEFMPNSKHFLERLYHCPFNKDEIMSFLFVFTIFPYTLTPLHPYTLTPLHPYTLTPLHPYTPKHLINNFFFSLLFSISIKNGDMKITILRLISNEIAIYISMFIATAKEAAIIEVE